MNYAKEIRTIKLLQDRFVKIQQNVQLRIKKIQSDLTAVIQAEWDKVFPGINAHFLSGLEGGCMTNKWEPKVYFYSVEGLEHHKGQFYDIYGDDIPRGTIIKKKPPIPIKKLRAFLKRMSEKTGVNCRLVNSSYVASCLSGEIKAEDYPI